MAQPNWYRLCVGCRNAKHKKELLRIVKFRNDQLEIDTTQKKQGRGAYICPKKECAMLALQRKGLDRSFHITVDRLFYEKLIQWVIQREK